MSRCEQFWKPAQIFAKWSLGLGFLGTESRARILLKLSSLGLGFSNKGLGVSASLGFYHSPPLLFLEANLWLMHFVVCRKTEGYNKNSLNWDEYLKTVAFQGPNQLFSLSRAFFNCHQSIHKIVTMFFAQKHFEQWLLFSEITWYYICL